MSEIEEWLTAHGSHGFDLTAEQRRLLRELERHRPRGMGALAGSVNPASIRRVIAAADEQLPELGPDRFGRWWFAPTARPSRWRRMLRRRPRPHRATCRNCERCTWNPGPDCGRSEHPHCPTCGHCEGRHE